MDPSPCSTAVHVCLGRMAYDRALAVQRRVHARRVANLVPDALFTVEHDAVFTCGRNGGSEGFRAGLDGAARAGIPVVRVERGGNVTYHGPGQLVAYPILDLRKRDCDVKTHVRMLEEAAIRTMASLGLDVGRRAGFPGVWTDRGKIASVGVYVRHWVTMHGLALNVAVNPEHFAMIDPCGLPVRAVSIGDELAEAPTMETVERRFVDEYGSLLGVTWQERPASWVEEGSNG